MSDYATLIRHEGATRHLSSERKKSHSFCRFDEGPICEMSVACGGPTMPKQFVELRIGGDRLPARDFSKDTPHDSTHPYTTFNHAPVEAGCYGRLRMWR